MSETTAKEVTNRHERRLEIALQAVPSKLGVTGSKEIPFCRAILSIRNTGDTAVEGFVSHATLAQEGGSVQGVTEALSRSKTVESILPGNAVEWDVYDLLIAGHPGVASKVHLWGYKAILNWWYTLAVWAEYQSSDSATPLQTPVSRWKLRWITAKPTLEEVDLSIEPVAD
ncbi:MAG: hypothetical protein NTW12_06580 [Deltaproteobacteria bacterium]|nr:hypothetical protein [Deltaproteobacteria bacterium]